MTRYVILSESRFRPCIFKYLYKIEGKPVALINDIQTKFQQFKNADLAEVISDIIPIVFCNLGDVEQVAMSRATIIARNVSYFQHRINNQLFEYHQHAEIIACHSGSVSHFT